MKLHQTLKRSVLRAFLLAKLIALAKRRTMGQHDNNYMQKWDSFIQKS